jgi:hypothetical protein
LGYPQNISGNPRFKTPVSTEKIDFSKKKYIIINNQKTTRQEESPEKINK